MRTYHKIQTIFKRDMENNPKHIIPGEWTLDEFEYLKNTAWYWEEKVDGTNIRVEFDGNTLDFKGRSDKAVIPTYLLDALYEEFLPKLDTFKEVFKSKEEGLEVVLYGEGYGNKIQKVGSKYRKDNGFALFDININGTWFTKEHTRDTALLLGIESVPFYGIFTLLEAVDIVKKGMNSKYNKDLLSEGLVGTPLVPLNNRMGGRIITKLKTSDFN